MSENLKDFPEILRRTGWVEAFSSPLCQSQVFPDGTQVSTACGTVAEAEAILDGFEEADREYMGLQLQLNKRYRNGFAIYNNLTFSQTEGSTFGGDAFDNTNDDYGEMMQLVLRPDDIDNCESRNPGGAEPLIVTGGSLFLGRSEREAPVDCQSLSAFLGQPLSTINRFGKATREKPVIFKSYGFKVWNFGKTTFNLGGLLNLESGVRWNYAQNGLNESQEGGNSAIDENITLYVEERGARLLGSRWWLNLSGAFTYAISNRVEAELRLEVTNVTDEQDQVGVSRLSGHPDPVKKSWAQPRKFRLLAAVRF